MMVKDWHSRQAGKITLVVAVIGCALVALIGLYLGVVSQADWGYAAAVVGIMAAVSVVGLLRQQREPECDTDTMSPRVTPADDINLNADVLTGGAKPQAVLDLSYLMDRMDHDIGSVVLLLEIFLTDHAEDGNNILRAVRQQDYLTAGKLAEALREVSASLGAGELSDQAGKIAGRLNQPGFLSENVVSEADCRQLQVALEDVVLVATDVLKHHVGSGDTPAVEPDTDNARAEPFIGEVNDAKAAEALVSSATVTTPALSPESTAPAASSDGLQATNRQAVKNQANALPAAEIDVRFLMQSLDNDVSAVQMLVELFIEEHAGDAAALTAMVRRGGQTEEAQRLVHTLKGVAGSLGARALKEVAAHIEAQYKHQQPVTLDDCNALSRVLNDTMDSARRYTVDVFEGA